MKLLRTLEDRGYPADYLLARIRKRRGALIADWRPLLSAAPLLGPSPRQGIAGWTEEDIWGNLLREFSWLYSQMNGALRETFAPLFLFFELRTIFLSLRNRGAGKFERIPGLLEHTLLAESPRRVLAGRGEIAVAVRELQGAFLSLSPRFLRLEERYRESGMRGFEEELTCRVLEEVRAMEPPPPVGGFFERLIDMRNIMAVSKQFRWQVRTPPRFLKGGRYSRATLEGAFAAGEAGEVNAIIRRFSGMEVNLSDAVAVEHALLKGMTLFLRREGRYPLGAGLILDYLWRSSLEARNLGILLHGRGIERERLAGELLQ